ncbi:MAG: hypothetical protein OEW32_01810 [Nitrospira sp.]|nr:hypothetical protein [Nitrospira sp.]
MAISKMTRRRGKEPKIMVAEPLLTVLLATKDNGHYCAKCPELDLVTELQTADAALGDLIEAIHGYAKEYLQDRDRCATSPNRAHHLPYIEAIAACKTDWELRTLIEIKHGLVHV